ncbi:hypothetical protein [Mycolicibacterium palauense]|uniref:hypothetical protein n=1 Tax=Mycolicibacterium palauense TaxID=2034511 RepID=UPI000BFEF2D7|nr:hypothetical protein [Mycolicibacterium palauense]
MDERDTAAPADITAAPADATAAPANATAAPADAEEHIVEEHTGAQPETESDTEPGAEDALAVLDDPAQEPSNGEAHAVVLRDRLERQLVAGQGLTRELVDATTDVSAALLEAPARVVAAVRGGATLPAALQHTGTDLREIVTGTGDHLRSVVGDYVGAQATLPAAVLAGTSDVAGALVRANGRVTATAVDGALSLGVVAVRGEDVRGAADQEWREVMSAFERARATVTETVTTARLGVREAVSI